MSTRKRAFRERPELRVMGPATVRLAREWKEEGKSSRVIGARLGVSHATVSNYLRAGKEA